MIYPLKNWQDFRQGYQHGSKTFYSDFHLGVDVMTPQGTPVIAPEAGVVAFKYGAQGGNTAELAGRYTHRFMHLSRYGRGGQVNEGDVIGWTGNTGLSTAPHLHWDVRENGALLSSRNRFRNPLALVDTTSPPTQEDPMIPIEAGTTIELTQASNLHSVPTEWTGKYAVTGALNTGDWAEIIEQTPDNHWLHVNAAGVKQGWLPTKFVKVKYRKDLIEKPAQTADTGALVREKAVAMAQALVESIKQL